MQGIVKWFNPEKGYGFIEQQGVGGDVFVHYSQIIEMDGYRTLAEGDPVEFEVEQRPKGLHALNVVVLRTEGDPRG